MVQVHAACNCMNTYFVAANYSNTSQKHEYLFRPPFFLNKNHAQEKYVYKVGQAKF
jgi:hypothetical protein